jgi:hypothetical protein
MLVTCIDTPIYDPNNLFKLFDPKNRWKKENNSLKRVYIVVLILISISIHEK